MRCVALRRVALRCVALRCVALRCVALRCNDFDCDSKGVVYLLKCQGCFKQYIGSTITVFRMQVNNHKSSLTGEHLYSHFFEAGHEGLSDIAVKIIDKTDYFGRIN